MNTLPFVSVIIGTKDRCKLLPRAIDTVLNQTYRNLECIVIDCASTDHTSEIFSAITDNRLKYHRLDRDPGRIESLNIGINKSEGSFITFLDDDDEYYPDKIERQVQTFLHAGDEVGIVYCWTNFYDEKAEKTIEIGTNHIEGDVFEYTLEKMSLCSFPALMFRKSALLHVGCFKDRVGYPSDWQMVCRMAQYFKVACVPEVLIKVNKNHIYEQMSRPVVKNSALFNRIINWHIDFLNEFETGYKKYPAKSLVHIYPLIAALAITGKYTTMFRFFLKAVKISPFSSAPYRLVFSGIIGRFKNHSLL